MTLDEALEAATLHASEWPNSEDRTRVENAAVVLAAEVIRLREQVAHLERLALRARSAGNGR